MKEPKDKFKFTTEYQWDLLRYTVQDKNGEKALKKYRDDYFTLTEHQVIAYTLRDYYKRERRIPGETILRERIVTLLNSKQYVNLVTKEEQKDIISLLKPLYKTIVQDGDEIYKLCKDFSNHIRIKQVIESVDINNYQAYPQFSKDISAAITDEDEIDELSGAFLLGSLKDRQFKRKENKTVFPTPYRQINQLTNAYGYEMASMLVILDKQKKGKTTALANLARGYLKMRKKILIVDLENGSDNIFFRLEQSIMKLTKLEILSGDHDDKVQKRFRKYKRFGGEVVVLRMPALVTTANDIQAKIDELYRTFGFQAEILMVDYLAKMASVDGDKDTNHRISKAYMEVQNLAEKNEIEHVWTANHVTRSGAKERQASKYQGEDIALCIEIVRHSQAIFGLNRTPEEEENGFFRMEVVEQRDGQPHGRAVFNLDMPTQRADELSATARAEYDENVYSVMMSKDDSDTQEVTKNRKSDI